MLIRVTISLIVLGVKWCHISMLKTVPSTKPVSLILFYLITPPSYILPWSLLYEAHNAEYKVNTTCFIFTYLYHITQLYSQHVLFFMKLSWLLSWLLLLGLLFLSSILSKYSVCVALWHLTLYGWFSKSMHIARFKLWDILLIFILKSLSQICIFNSCTINIFYA